MEVKGNRMEGIVFIQFLVVLHESLILLLFLSLFCVRYCFGLIQSVHSCSI